MPKPYECPVQTFNLLTLPPELILEVIQQIDCVKTLCAFLEATHTILFNYINPKNFRRFTVFNNQNNFFPNLEPYGVPTTRWSPVNSGNRWKDIVNKSTIQLVELQQDAEKIMSPFSVFADQIKLFQGTNSFVYVHVPHLVQWGTYDDLAGYFDPSALDNPVNMDELFSILNDLDVCASTIVTPRVYELTSIPKNIRGNVSLRSTKIMEGDQTQGEGQNSDLTLTRS
ncbi:hypothetical protein BON22_0072 [Cyberlindnera fabianii]|uniref:Uncharacterized protein n=1 Tax=Cyberlindnera fabianii TaxID=36022 RepID=A0A1V2LCY3_CYBFA|nr:hypothetical protein BON22_0072 [Cyberlindnera fabianii]